MKSFLHVQLSWGALSAAVRSFVTRTLRTALIRYRFWMSLGILLLGVGGISLIFWQLVFSPPPVPAALSAGIRLQTNQLLRATAVAADRRKQALLPLQVPTAVFSPLPVTPS